MATTIITKNGSGAPLSGNLVEGELAIDLTNKQLYTKSGTSVVKLGNSGDAGQWEQNGNDIYYDSGNVGIGTDNPSSVLTVSRGGTSGLIAEFQGDNASGARGLQITSKDSSGTVGSLIDFNAKSSSTSAALSYSVGGTERMRIDSDGNVGIGTDSPSALLTLSSSSNTEIKIIDGTKTSKIFTQNGGRDLQIQANQDLIINASGGTNVGIGTTNPTNKLEVNGATGIRADGGGYLTKFLNSSSTSEMTAYIYDNNQDHLQITAYDSSYDLAFGTNNTEAMRIDSSGNVGINTSSPSSKLHVKGSNSGASAVADGTLIVEQGSTPSIQILSANTQAQSLKFGDPEDGDAGKITYSHSNNWMAFDTSGSEAMRLDEDGNVGIGASGGDPNTTGSRSLYLYRANATGVGASLTLGNRGNGASGGQTDILFESSRGGNAGYGGRISMTNSGILAFATQDPTSGYGLPSASMLIDSTGRVGIGGAPGTGAGTIGGGTAELQVAGDGYFSGTVDAGAFTVNGSPLTRATDLIETLSTLRQATRDETTLEGLRDAIGNAIGGLIEKFEAQINNLDLPEEPTE